MSVDDFGTVDIDLLADYIGDALDEAERARVERLIADDPEWRSAHDLLAPGMSRVGAELGALGAASEPMPDDLEVHLEAAFAADPTTDHDLIAPELTEPSEPHVQPSRGDRHLVSVPTGGTARAISRRRRIRWAAPIAAAAGVLAFAGFGTTYLTSRDDAAQTSAADGAADSAAAPMMAPESGPAAAPPGGQITVSGMDYTEDELKAGVPAPMTAAGKDSGSTSRAEGTADQNSLQDLRRIPAPLVRLREQSALLACLEAIAQQNAAGPIAVQAVDYASYAGAAALIVRFSADGTDWAWATGPDCGSPGRGAQVRKAVRVG